MPKYAYPGCLLTLACLSTQLALAQTTPDAGALLQQIEKARPPLPPKPPAPINAAPQPLRQLAGPTVTVTAFRFAGNTLLSEEQLAAAVSGFRDHPLSFAELEEAAAAVAALYRRAGWIVRAYLPHQEIKDGVVTIQIVEAVFGDVRLDGPRPSRIAPERLLPFVHSAQPKGAMLNAPALDRALLLLGDMPGITASGTLAPGQQAGETDLLLKIEDGPLLNGVFSADNSGSRSTGPARFTGELYFNSLLHVGDQIGVSLLHTKGSDYGRVDATAPLGSDGLRVGANASYLRYRLVSADTAALHAKGNSTSAGLGATYPLIRARLQNLNVSLNYDNKRFDNEASGATVTDYNIDTVTASLYGNLLDQFAGGGNNNASVALVRGKVDLDGSPNQAADALTTRSAGNFTKLRYSASRLQVLTESLALYAGLTGQASNRNLDSAEKFYLGGAYGVRAYPANEGGGSSGQLVSVELRARLPQNLALTGFYDWGHVTLNHRNDFAGAATVNSYSLRGGGASLAWLGPRGISLKATWARRTGSNPNPTFTGNDQDGSLTRNRFWLQASLPF
jgi:hemolysin activation/secretion protein